MIVANRSLVVVAPLKLYHRVFNYVSNSDSRLRQDPTDMNETQSRVGPPKVEEINKNEKTGVLSINSERGPNRGLAWHVEC